MSFFSEIMLQTGYYAIVGFLCLFFVGFFLKGFFTKYVKVRLSFGKYVLIRIKSALNYKYAIGSIDSGFLVYKNDNKEEIRIAIPEEEVFYKSLSINWVDVEEEKNAILKADYKGVSGFDAIKYNNLFLRALYKPELKENKEKLLLMILLGVGAISLICAYLVYVQSTRIDQIYNLVNTINKGIITTAK